MHGSGTFFDPRLNDATQFPVAARAGMAQRPRGRTDLITAKLAPLQFYQLAIPAPAPPAGSFDARAAEHGQALFNGTARCSTCHVAAALHRARLADAHRRRDRHRQLPGRSRAGSPLSHDAAARRVVAPEGRLLSRRPLRRRSSPSCSTTTRRSTCGSATRSMSDLVEYLEIAVSSSCTAATGSPTTFEYGPFDARDESRREALDGVRAGLVAPFAARHVPGDVFCRSGAQNDTAVVSTRPISYRAAAQADAGQHLVAASRQPPQHPRRLRVVVAAWRECRRRRRRSCRRRARWRRSPSAIRWTAFRTADGRRFLRRKPSHVGRRRTRPSRGDSSTSAETISNVNPAARSSSARRGDADARIRRMLESTLNPASSEI